MGPQRLRPEGCARARRWRLSRAGLHGLGEQRQRRAVPELRGGVALDARLLRGPDADRGGPGGSRAPAGCAGQAAQADTDTDTDADADADADVGDRRGDNDCDGDRAPTQAGEVSTLLGARLWEEGARPSAVHSPLPPRPAAHPAERRTGRDEVSDRAGSRLHGGAGDRGAGVRLVRPMGQRRGTEVQETQAWTL